MKKALLIFTFALFCFTSIQCSSWSWKDCGNGKVGWTTANVTIDQPPVIGKNVTAKVCEINTSPIAWEISGYLVQSVHTLDINIFFSDFEFLRKGESRCWNINFLIPVGVRPNLTVQTIFQNALAAAGCAQFDFHFASSERGFLSLEYDSI